MFKEEENTSKNTVSSNIYIVFICYFFYFILYIHIDKQHRVGERDWPSALQTTRGGGGRGGGRLQVTINAQDRYSWAFSGGFGKTMLDSVPSHVAQTLSNGDLRTEWKHKAQSGFQYCCTEDTFLHSPFLALPIGVINGFKKKMCISFGRYPWAKGC